MKNKNYLPPQESLSFLRSSQYDTSTANPTHLDMSEEYKATCIDGKNLPIRNPLSQFCRTASFTQISKFNGGAKACSCHPRGSVSKQCENIGGQCKCHRNIIGRRCHSCRAGFYNFPYCISKYTVVSFIPIHFYLSVQFYPGTP